jgi:hypothetical protein
MMNEYVEIPTSQVHKYSVGKNAEFLNVTADGTYIYYDAV